MPLLGAATVGAGMWSIEPRGARATVTALEAPKSLALPPVAHRSARFVIRGDVDPALAREGAAWLEHVADVFDREARAMGFEPLSPRGPLTVIFLARRDDFVAFASRTDGVDASGMGGYYAPGSNHAVVYDDRSTESFATALASADPHERGAAAHDAHRATQRKLAHEAAHLLAFNTGVQRPDVDYPAWFTEGLAERVAARAMGDERRRTTRDRGGLASLTALLFSACVDERYAAAQAAFDGAFARPGAAARFARGLEQARPDGFVRAVED